MPGAGAALSSDFRPAQTPPLNPDPARQSFVFLVPWDLNGPGGVIEVVKNLYRQVEEDGTYQPAVLVNDWVAKRPKIVTDNGRRTIRFRVSSPSPGNSLLGFLKWLTLSPLFFFDFWRLCRRERIAVINVHYPSPGALGPALLRMVGAYRGRLILSFHGLELQGARNAGWIQASVWRFILRHTDAVVAVSRAFGNEAEEFAGGRAPVVVIHNGVDADVLRAGARRASNPLTELNGRDIILTVAKIESRKGVDVLVRSFAELRRTNPRLALVVVGQPGDSSADVHSLTEELGLGDDVFFYDNVPHDEMGAFFEKATVVCMPSRSETFGIVLLEAGVFHRPVVATRIGGIPEVIEDGENGLLVESDDVPGLTEALRRVLDDPKLAARLADRLSQRVDAEFTWKRAYADYRALVDAAGRGAVVGERG